MTFSATTCVEEKTDMSMASDGSGFDKTLDPMVKAAMAFMAAFCKSLTTGLLEALLDSAYKVRKKTSEDHMSTLENRSVSQTKKRLTALMDLILQNALVSKNRCFTYEARKLQQ